MLTASMLTASMLTASVLTASMLTASMLINWQLAMMDLNLPSNVIRLTNLYGESLCPERPSGSLLRTALVCKMDRERERERRGGGGG
eukprot:COSAG03_NODE_6847_length_996_cov_2.777035_1_plen_86_part_01